MMTAVIDTATVVIVCMTAVTVNMTAVILNLTAVILKMTQVMFKLTWVILSVTQVRFKLTEVILRMTGISGAQQAQWALRFAAFYRLSVTSCTRLKPASLRIASTSETRS